MPECERRTDGHIFYINIARRMNILCERAIIKPVNSSTYCGCKTEAVDVRNTSERCNGFRGLRRQTALLLLCWWWWWRWW